MYILAEHDRINYAPLLEGLHQVSALVADPDLRAARFAKWFLLELGLKEVYLANNGEEALRILSEQDADLLFTEADMTPVDGFELTRMLRALPNSPFRMIPIVMMTSRMHLEDVANARDIGVNEYVVKPYNAKTIFQRVMQLIDRPRSFVICVSYAGPDRRRKGTPPDGIERRQPELAVMIDPRSALNLPDDGRPKIILPDNNLKRKMGLIVEEPPAFQPAPLQTLVAAPPPASDDEDIFQQWISQDIARLREAYQRITEGEEMGAPLNDLKDAAGSIRARASSFHYPLGAQIASLLMEFATKKFRAEHPGHRVALRKFIDALARVFTDRMQGSGGASGAALVTDIMTTLKVLAP